MQEHQDIGKYHDYIQNLPPVDSPNVFGLHISADTNFRNIETTNLISSVTAIQPKDTSGGGESPEQFVLNKCNEYSEKIKGDVDYNLTEVRKLIETRPAPLIRAANEKDKPDRGLRAPLNIFLWQEVCRMQRIIVLVKRMLVDMRDAIEGTIIMSAVLQSCIASIYDAKVPACWITEPSGAEISWISDSISKWMEQFLERFRQQTEWLEKGKLQEYRLDTMFNPQGFITSVKQEITRSHKQDKWSLDEMVQETFVKAIKSSDKLIPDEGVYLKGMTVEGSKFNNSGLLDELQSKIYDDVPPIMLSFKKKVEGGKKESEEDICPCPVQKYKQRTDRYQIFRIDLKIGGLKATDFEECTRRDISKMRGTALFASYD